MVDDLMLRLSEEEWEIFWVQCWLAWNQRYLIMHGGKLQDPTRLNKKAQEYCEEFREAQCRLAIPTSTGSMHKWCPPSGSAFKLNFDVAVFSNTSSSGFGAIIRNRMGEVMAGLSARGSYVASSEEGEVLACQKALEFAINARFTEIVLEGDNAKVMKLLMSPRVNRSRLGHNYEDIRTLASGLEA